MPLPAAMGDRLAPYHGIDPLDQRAFCGACRANFWYDAYVSVDGSVLKRRVRRSRLGDDPTVAAYKAALGEHGWEEWPHTLIPVSLLCYSCLTKGDQLGLFSSYTVDLEQAEVRGHPCGSTAALRLQQPG